MKKKTDVPHEPDARLLSKAKDGDTAAFTQIVRRYEQMVYSFAFKVCRDEEKASETVQDTFINVYRKLKQFDGKSKFSTWLYSIVTNNCLMKRRRRKIDEALVRFDDMQAIPGNTSHDEDGHAIQTIPSWKETPDEVVMNRELQALLDKAILRLPSDYRIVFILRDVEERSAEETAKILKLSVPAVKSRLHRARAFLRNQLNEYMTS